jgi:hypothetical protein
MGGLALPKASFILPSLESLWGCQEIQMEDLNWGASQSSQLQTQARVQFTMLGRCLGLSQKCPNPGHKTKLGSDKFCKGLRKPRGKHLGASSDLRSKDQRSRPA